MRNYHRGTNPHHAHHEIAAGNVPFRDGWRAWGAATLAAAGTTYPIWAGGTSAPVFQLSPSTLTVTSSSATDNFTSGSGARVVQLIGTNALGQSVTEYVNTNGVSAVATTNQFFCVYDARVVTAGSNQANAGDITIRAAPSTNILAVIPTAIGAKNGCVFQPPMEMPYTISNLQVSSYSAATPSPITTVRIVSVTYGYQSSITSARSVLFEGRIPNSQNIDFGAGLLVPRNTMVYVEATAGANSAGCSAMLTGVYGVAR